MWLLDHCRAEYVTSFPHISRLCATDWVFSNELSVHSVTLSNHFVFCLPFSILHKVVPCRMAVERLLALMTCLYHFNFLFLTVVRYSLPDGILYCVIWDAVYILDTDDGSLISGRCSGLARWLFILQKLPLFRLHLKFYIFWKSPFW